MRKSLSILAVSLITALSACNVVNSDLERAVVGAAIGCVAGETLVNGRCVEGAVVGAGVGVLTN